LQHSKGRCFVVLIAILSMAALLIARSDGVYARRSVSALRSKRLQTYRQIKNVKASLRKVKGRQTEVTGQLNVAQRRLEDALARKADVTRQLEATQKELHKTKAELEKTQRKLAEHEDALGERLRAINRKGPGTYLAVILNSTDFTDLANRSYLCRKVVTADIELLKRIQREKENLDAKRAELESKEVRRRQLVAQIRAEEQRIRQAKAQKQETLKKVMSDRKKLEQALAEMEAESKALEAEIRRLTSVGSRYRYSGRWTGKLGNPCPGAVLTSRFGMRFHPILHVRKMHTGVDLAAPYGTKILAAADGKVIFTGWRRGYGKTVIIDHGGGLTTLYGHCASYLTAPGRIVKRGQPIARMDSTGLSTGNHLHFEKRINGRPVNPL